MKKAIILFFLFFSFNSFSQIIKVWDKDIGSGDLEDAVLVYKNPNKTIDVIAKVRNAGNDVTLAYGQHDYWFGKFSSTGQLLSDYTYGGTAVDFCKSAVKTTDGGYLIAGVSYSGASGIKTDALPSGNTNVLWVIKIDTAGQLQWQKQMAFNSAGSGTSSVDYYKGPVVCNTSSGYVIICNTSWTNTSGQIMYSTYTIPIDFYGNFSPRVTMGINSYPQNNFGYSQANLYINYVYQLSNGNLMALGWGYKNAVTTKRIAVAILLSSTGTYISHTEYTSSGDCEIISGKELSANGNRLLFARSKHNNLTGFSRTVSTKSSSGNADIWVFKTNNVGGSVFDERAIGCGADNLSEDLVMQSSRNVYYLGNNAYIILGADGVGFDKSENPKGFRDYWLVNYNFSTNQIVNEKTLGGSSYEMPQSVFTDGQDVYLLGTSQSAISGDKTEAVKSGSSDIWMVKACLTASPPTIANTFPFWGDNYAYACVGDQHLFTLSNPNPDYSYKWYTTSTGTQLLTTGTSFTTPVLTDGQVYTAWVEPNNGPCKGPRVSVRASPVHKPEKPKVSGRIVLCKGENLLLVAKKDSIVSGGVFDISRWYDSTGTNIIHYGDTLRIQNIQQDFKIYLSTTDSVPAYPAWGFPNHECESPKLLINITIDEPPSPIVNRNHPNCNFTINTLSVTNASNDTVKWYDKNNMLLYKGNPFIYTTQKLIDSVYVKLKTENSCESSLEKVLMDVSSEKPVSVFNTGQTILNPGDVIQFNNQSLNGQSYNWDFGDLSHSVQSSPWHYFYNPGYYTIKLITTAPNGCNDTLEKTNYVFVNNYTGIGSVTIAENIKIFPNPFSEKILVSLPDELQQAEYMLVNQLGEIILNGQIKGTEVINTQDLPSGLYYLRILSEEKFITVKLIHQ